jgi:hypothetical protein
MALNDEQEAQRQRARTQLTEALERVRAAEAEVRMWAPLTVMNTLTALEAELQTILARL